MHKPVRTVEDLNTLDFSEMEFGYKAGRLNLPCPENATRSYWHGWRNGRSSSGHVACDEDQNALAMDFVPHNEVYDESRNWGVKWT